MLGISIAAVVALVAGLLVWKATSGQGPGGPTPTANDGDRTVGLLRERDPVCDDWTKFADALAAKEKPWAAADDTIPASGWSPGQREIFTSAGVAMSTAADQFESILPKARSVILQSLIAQTIVYLREYVDRLPNYVEADGLIAGVANNFGGAVTYVCSAVVLANEASVSEIKITSATPDPAALTPFMAEHDPVCADLLALIDRQSAELRGWMAGNSTMPAKEWSPEQQALNNAAREVISRDSKQFRELGERTTNPVMADVLTTLSAYMKAFADALPTYVPDDAKLWTAATYLGGGLSAACKAEL